jgi:hypothetical protein
MPKTDRGLRDTVLDAEVIDLDEKMWNKDYRRLIEMVLQFGYKLLERAFGSTNIILTCIELSGS